MADIKHVQPAHPPEARTEADGVNYRGIVWFVVILVVTTAVCQVLMVGTFKLFEKQTNTADPGRPVMMAPMVEPKPGPAVVTGAPGPSLLTDEPSNLHEFRQGEDTQMHGYSWVDRNAGTVRIPIDRAKELLLQRGISGGKPIPPSTTNPSTNTKTNKGGGQR